MNHISLELQDEAVKQFFLDLPAFTEVLGSWLQSKSGQWRPNVLRFSLNLLGDLQTALRQTSPSLGKAAGYQTTACNSDAAGEFPSDLAIVRRYGNH